MPDVHAQGHVWLASVAAEVALTDQEADQEPEVELRWHVTLPELFHRHVTRETLPVSQRAPVLWCPAGVRALPGRGRQRGCDSVFVGGGFAVGLRGGGRAGAGGRRAVLGGGGRGAGDSRGPVGQA